MKKYILLLIVVFPSFLIGQTSVNIQPDTTIIFLKDPNPIWYDNSTTFYNYQGNLLMFTFKTESGFGGNRAFLHVYKYAENENGNYFEELSFGGANKIAFGFYYEDSYLYYAAKIMYRAHAFEYNGQVWYHAFIRDREIYNYYYDCYAQLPLYLESSESCFKYFNKVPYHKPPQYDVVKGALQMDENIWFFTHNPSTNKWSKETAYLNTYNKFQKINVSPWAEGDNFYPELGGIIQYYDNSGNTCYAFNTYDKNNSFSNLSFYKDLPVGQWYRDNGATSDCPAATLIKGTINGNRNTVYGARECNERFTLFELSTIKANGVYPIYYREYCTNSEGDTLPLLVASGKVNTPSSRPPSHVNGDEYGKGYYLYSTYDYTQIAYTTLNEDPITHEPQPDGMQQSVCLFYPCSNNTFTELGLYSDVWRPDMSSIVKSTDLDKDSDSVYGKSVRGLWTLTGILDGAPPCSIDWDIWNPLHPDDVDATSLTFTSEQGSTTEVSLTSDDQFSIGESMSFGIEGIFNVKEKMKYTYAFKNKQSQEFSTTTRITHEYGLNEVTQDQGYFLWTIPQIQRTSYQVYPWWDADSLLYPIDSTLQYMFRTFGIHLKQDAINLSEFPFLVEEPNAPDMAWWQIANRNGIYDASNIPGVNVGEVNWYNDGNHGTTLEFVQETTTTQSTESSSSFEIEIEEGLNIPGVFDIGLSEGTKIDYSTENTFSTTFGTELTASLHPLKEDGVGINVPQLSLNVYWFWPDPGTGWWFYDSLDTQQYPWYIAYAIVSTKAQIELFSPIEDDPIKKSDMIFCWETLYDELNDFKIFIGTSAHLSPSNIIYQEAIGDKKWLNPLNFNTETGKPYYWAVSGVASTGETVWSKTNSFTIKDNIAEALQGNDLKAIVYPNPIKNDQVSVSFDTEVTGIFNVSLFDVSGRLLYGKKVEHEGNVISTISIPTASLSKGIYTVRIQSGTLLIAKKLVVMDLH